MMAPRKKKKYFNSHICFTVKWLGLILLYYSFQTDFDLIGTAADFCLGCKLSDIQGLFYSVNQYDRTDYLEEGTELKSFHGN